MSDKTTTNSSLKETSRAHRVWREKNAKHYEDYQKQYAKQHSAQKSAATTAWRSQNQRTDKTPPDKQRWATLKCRFGLTRDRFEAILAGQNGVCAICSTAPKGNLHVDHDHATNVIRGLLCGNCNRALGLMKDDPRRLRQAATYLEKPMSDAKKKPEKKSIPEQLIPPGSIHTGDGYCFRPDPDRGVTLFVMNPTSGSFQTTELTEAEFDQVVALARPNLIDRSQIKVLTPLGDGSIRSETAFPGALAAKTDDLG